MKKVQVKFCGGCNPHIDRGLVYKKIRELSRGEGFVFTTEDGSGASLILLIEGCPTGCTLPEGSLGHLEVVRIAGESVNMARVEESDIAQETVKAIRAYLFR